MITLKTSDTDAQTVLKKAVEVLAAGGMIIYPTETCYGVGVDATNTDSVSKLLRYKDRPEGKPISIAVSSKKMASEYVDITKTAQNLYDHFLPGPITVVSQARKEPKNNAYKVADGIVAEDGSLGIRVPDYDLTIRLIDLYGKPITATSANRSGKKTPYTINDIVNNTTRSRLELVDLVIDAGELPHNPPSTVVVTRLNDERVLRKGTVEISKLGNYEIGASARNNTQHISSRSPQETIAIGKKLMNELLPYLKNKCIVLAVQGDLGAGKTQFAKGVAQALGIAQTITSPTYTIVKEYQFQVPGIRSQGSGVRSKDGTIPETYHLKPDTYLYHIDTWRMEDQSELEGIGLSDMIKKGNVIVIEWAQKIAQALGKMHSQGAVVQKIFIENTGKSRKIFID